MFLRQHRWTVDGKCYEYWTLVKTVRSAKGPRQELVATLGKEPGLESRTRQGWEQVADPKRRSGSAAKRSICGNESSRLALGVLPACA